jgi:hypothetical protein
MAKTSGLGSLVEIADSSSVLQAIYNDITNFQFASPKGIQDVTGIDKSAHERLELLADYSATFNGVFNNGGTASSHAVFKTIPSTSVNREVRINPVGGTTPAMDVNCVLTDYQLTRANDGALTWVVPAALADGAVPTWG